MIERSILWPASFVPRIGLADLVEAVVYEW